MAIKASWDEIRDLFSRGYIHHGPHVPPADHITYEKTADVMLTGVPDMVATLHQMWRRANTWRCATASGELIPATSTVSRRRVRTVDRRRQDRRREVRLRHRRGLRPDGCRACHVASAATSRPGSTATAQQNRPPAGQRSTRASARGAQRFAEDSPPERVDRVGAAVNTWTVMPSSTDP